MFSVKGFSPSNEDAQASITKPDNPFSAKEFTFSRSYEAGQPTSVKPDNQQPIGKVASPRGPRRSKNRRQFRQAKPTARPVPKENDRKHLLDVIEAGDLKQLQEYLKDETEDPNTPRKLRAYKPNTELQSPVGVAAATGNLEILDFLISRGFDAREKGTTYMESKLYRFEPIDWAVKKGHLEVVRSLLQKHGVSPVKTDPDSEELLCYAILGGHLDVVKLLVQAGAAVDYVCNKNAQNFSKSWLNVETTETSTALRHAVESENMELVKFLIEAGAAVNECCGRVNSPILSHAVSRGNVEICRYLIENGANIHGHDQRNETPMILAVKENRKDIVQLLVDHGGKDEDLTNYICRTFPEAVTFGQLKRYKPFTELRTPLAVAVMSGNTEMFDFLVSHGFDPHEKCMPSKGSRLHVHTPLEWAIMTGHLEIVKSLVNTHGGSVNLLDNNTMSPLCHAVLGGYSDVVNFLIQKGAEVDTTCACDDEIQISETGSTPLSHAVESGNLDVIKLLVEAGASVAPCSSNGFMQILNHPLSVGNLEVCSYLVEKGADVKSLGRKGEPPLFKAIRTTREAMVSFLLDHGVSVNARDSSQTPFEFALFDLENLEVAKLLYSRGANLDLETPDGHTLLKDAIYRGNYEATFFLITECNASIENRMSQADSKSAGWGSSSPLYIAVMRREKIIMELLLSLGCNLSKERWLRDPEDEIHENGYLRDTIGQIRALAATATPPSLGDFCIFRIRRLLGKHVQKSEGALPLPEPLRNKVRKWVSLETR